MSRMGELAMERQAQTEYRRSLRNTVHLTPFEEGTIGYCGSQRWKNARGNNRDAGQGTTRDAQDSENDRRGAKGEYALSILLNLYWRPTIGELRRRDVGGLIDCRTVENYEFCLFVKPADIKKGPKVPLVLMQQHDAYTYEAIGWIFPEDAPKLSELHTHTRDHAYLVRRGDLPDMDELRAWVKENAR